MSAVIGLLLAQAAPQYGAVVEPSPELGAAYQCLIKQTDDWLIEFNWNPETDERWRWALKIVAGCQKEIEIAAKARGATDLGIGCSYCTGISTVDALRSEATYFVDRRIHQNFGAAQ